MKFNRVVLVVVSLALMLFALAGCGKDAAQDSQKKLNVVANGEHSEECWAKYLPECLRFISENW